MSINTVLEQTTLYYCIFKKCCDKLSCLYNSTQFLNYFLKISKEHSYTSLKSTLLKNYTFLMILIYIAKLLFRKPDSNFQYMSVSLTKLLPMHIVY